MEASFASKVLRLILSVTIIFTSTQAFAGAPPTQTGGGGGQPPNSPPPPVDLGGDDRAPEPRRENPGSNHPTGARKFMDVYGVTADGKTIYYEGQMDGQGRIRVFKYSYPDPKFISRGVIVADNAHPDGMRVQWLRGGGTIEGLRNELAARENSAATPEPQQRAAVPAKPPVRWLLDPVQVTDASGKTETAYFQGRQDAFKREMVLRPVTISGQADVLYYRTGVVEAEGKVTWNADYTRWEKLIEQLTEANYGKREKAEQTGRIQRLRERAFAEEMARASKSRPIEVRNVSPHSNYPELPRPTEPIPPGRALVPVGQVQDLPVRNGPGTSESNSPGKEYFPEMDPQYKPSRIRRAARITKDNVEFVKEEIQKLVRGRPNALVGSSPEVTGGNLTENPRAPSYELPRGVAGFYVGLGMATALMLYLDYANNPAAWNTYVQSMTDPMAITQLAAFMAAAGGSYWAMSRMTTKMFGPDAMAKGIVYRPMVVGSIAIGALASTVLMEVIADPNTSKCLGFDELKAGRFPYRNYEACDKLWDRWSSNDHWNTMAVNQLVPMFANMVVAGGLWQATLIGTHYLFSRQAIALGLRSLRFGFSAKGGWVVKILGAAVNVAIFMGAYYISEKIFGVGQWVREEMTDTWSFSNDPNGASIQETEGLLLREWATLKKQGFKNPDLWNKVCFDSSRKYGMFYNCDEPNRLNFLGLLNKYSDFQQAWRKVKMTDTENAYKQWRVKSDEYYATLEIAHDFYRLALMNPEKFTPEFNERFKKQQEARAQDNWKLLKGANPDGEWKYVSTYNITDYLVASMACGPEAEGYGQNENTGLFGRIGGFWTNWVSGNTTPTEVLTNSTGWKIQFHPPRITTPLARGESNVCQTGGISRGLPVGPPLRLNPAAFPSSTEKGNYRNLFDYIRAEVRPAVYANGQSTFTDWWEKNITPPSNEVDQQLRKDYEHLLSNEYLSALKKKDYKRCYPSKVKDTGLEKYLRQLGRSDDACPAEGMDRLSHGVLLGMRDEMRLYLAMLIDLQMSNLPKMGVPGTSSYAQAEKENIDQANLLIELMDKMLEGAKQIETAKRLDLKEITTTWFAISNAHKRNFISPLTVAPERPLDPRLAEIRRRMNDKIQEMEKADEALRPRLRYEFQQLQTEWTRVEKSIPRPVPTVFEQNKYLEEWAFALGVKIDSVFVQALSLYKILTLFEQ